MTALLSKATRGLWTLAGVVLVLGLGLFVYRRAPLGVEPALQSAGAYVRAALSPLVLLSACMALVLVVGSHLATLYARRAPPPLVKRPALSPLEVVNEDVAIAVREMLVELGRFLRQVATSPDPDIIVFMDTLM